MAPKVVTSNYKKVKKNKKVDGNISPIPKFSYKSAVIIVLSAALSCFFLPNMIAGFGVDTRITTLIGNAVIISFAVCYCRYFIRFCRRGRVYECRCHPEIYFGTAYFLYGTLDYSGFYIFFYRKNERECFTDAGMGIRIGLSFVCRSCFYGHVFRLLADPVTDY